MTPMKLETDIAGNKSLWFFLKNWKYKFYKKKAHSNEWAF